jgi:transcription initiation factor IIE alpha subunit
MNTKISKKKEEMSISSMFRMNMFAFTETINGMIKDDLILQTLAIEVEEWGGDEKLYVALLHLQLKLIPMILRKIRKDKHFDYKTVSYMHEYTILIKPYFQGMDINEAVQMLQVRLVQIPYLLDEVEARIEIKARATKS